LRDTEEPAGRTAKRGATIRSPSSNSTSTFLGPPRFPRATTRHLSPLRSPRHFRHHQT
jgi:hypothetical protein